MTQEAFYYQVTMHEEYMARLKDFTEQLREEFVASQQEYCCYCGDEKTDSSCCGEHHFEPFVNLSEDIQQIILDAEIQNYERATK